MKTDLNLPGRADSSDVSAWITHNLELGYSVTVIQRQPAGQLRHAVLIMGMPHDSDLQAAYPVQHGTDTTNTDTDTVNA